MHLGLLISSYPHSHIVTHGHAWFTAWHVLRSRGRQGKDIGKSSVALRGCSGGKGIQEKLFLAICSTNLTRTHAGLERLEEHSETHNERQDREGSCCGTKEQSLRRNMGHVHAQAGHERHEKHDEHDDDMQGHALGGVWTFFLGMKREHTKNREDGFIRYRIGFKNGIDRSNGWMAEWLNGCKPVLSF